MREIILLTCVIVSVPLVFKRPIWGIAIYLGLNVIRPEMMFWGGHDGAYVFKAYYGLIIISVLLRGYLAKISEILKPELMLMVWLNFAVFVSMEFSSFPVAGAGYYALELVKTTGFCIFVYLVVHEFKDIRTIQNALLGCFTVLGVWGIDQQLRGNVRLEGLGGNSWGDSNGVAAIFVMFLPVALAKLFSSTSRKEYWGAVVMTSIMVALIVCTKSRGGMVGLVAGVVAFGFYTRNIKKIALVSLMMAVVAMPFASQLYLERLKTMKSRDTLDASANSRIVLWQTGLMVFSDNPIFGTGFLTFPEAKMKYVNRFNDLEDDFRSGVFRENNKKVPHNTYIQIMSECGILGIIPFAMLVGGGVVAGLRARRLLLHCPEYRLQITWLCGICAGITGFAVCMIAVDLALVIFLYVQLVIIGILSRMLMRHEYTTLITDPAPAGEHA